MYHWYDRNIINLYLSFISPKVTPLLQPFSSQQLKQRYLKLQPFTHQTNLPASQNTEVHFKLFVTLIIRVLDLWTFPVPVLMGTSPPFNELPGSPLSTGCSEVNSRGQRSQDHRLHNASDCWLLMLRLVLQGGVGLLCVCVCVFICLIVCIFFCLCIWVLECMCECQFLCMHPDMFACVLMHANAVCAKGGTWLAGPPWQMKLDGLQAL